MLHETRAAGEVGGAEQGLPRSAGAGAFGSGGLFKAAEHVGVDEGVVVLDACALFEAFHELAHFVMASAPSASARDSGASVAGK